MKRIAHALAAPTKLAALASLASLAQVCAAHAEVHVDETVDYYDVSGAAPEDILAEMRAKAPPSPFSGERRFFAFTRWHVRWRYALGEVNGVCRLQQANVRVEVTHSMPRWSGRGAASPALAAHWDAFERNLWTHERGHRDIGVSVAHEVEDALLSVGPRATCTALSTEVNALASSIIDRSSADADYDRATQHGRTQGAVFDIGRQQ